MKGRFISLALSVVLIFVILPFSGHVFSEQKLDPMGFDPWLSLYHDESLSGYSKTQLKHPLEIVDDYPLQIEDSKIYQLSNRFVVYNGRVFFQGQHKDEIDSHELFVCDLETAKIEASTILPGIHIKDLSPLVLPDLGRIITVSNNIESTHQELASKSFITALDLITMKISWSIEISGASFGSIQQSENNLYLKTFTLEQTIENDIEYSNYKASTIYKIDAKTGKIVWNKSLDYSGLAASAMISVYGDRLFSIGFNYRIRNSSKSVSYSNSVHLQCIHTDNGNLIWEKELQGFRRSGSASTDGKMVYAVLQAGGNSDNYQAKCIALNTNNGDLVWEFTEKGFLAADITPKNTTESVVFASRTGHVFAINKSDGALLWHHQHRDDNMFINFKCEGTALTDDYVLLLGDYSKTTSGQIVSKSLVLMLNMQNGRILWKDYLNRDSYSISSLAIYGQGIVVLDRHTNKLFHYISPLPKLTVFPAKINLGDLEHGSKKIFDIKISNSGYPGLKGKTIVSEPEWMGIEPQNLDDDTKRITLTIDTAMLDVKSYDVHIAFESNGGNLIVPVSFNVIDTTAPAININKDDFIEIDGKYYTKHKNQTLSGKTEPNVKVFIQGNETMVDEIGNFKQALQLNEGKNDIKIEAISLGNNRSEMVFTIYLDTIAPVITMITPDYKLCTSDIDTLTGKVDDKNAKVLINEHKVPVSPDGTFIARVSLELGNNFFVIKATDLVGNESRLMHYMVYPEKKLILLYIGKAQAEINGKPYVLDVPPMIVKSTTMVPLRFVGEAIGASLDWNAPEQRITFILYGRTIKLWVGKTSAMVNDEQVSLAVAPMIVNGRTLVPVRFVSENLGSKVDWDGKLQRITITFPSPLG